MAFICGTSQVTPALPQSTTAANTVKRKALTSALSDRAGAERVTVLEDLGLAAPKTSKVASVFASMALPGRHTLFVVEPGGDTLW